MTKLFKLLKNLLQLFISLFKKTKKDNKMLTTWEKSDLLTPIKHKRYISVYCIADLTEGSIPIYTPDGTEISRISNRSKKRLDMEGTGTLPNGDVVNVAKFTGGGWTYRVMGPEAPYGVGINSISLVPWFSLAVNLKQLREHSLLKRRVVIPALKNYVTPDGAVLLGGVFEVHDTGGGLRSTPYKNGLWRTGESKSKYGQFDLFVGGPESMYKKLLSVWDSYLDVFVLPRDLTSSEGIQETLNLLLDSGLEVDGIVGPKTQKAILQLKEKAGLDLSSFAWDDHIKRYVQLCLKNW